MLLLCSSYSFSQLRGQIIQPGDGTIDPNGDGFVSETTAGFSNDGYYVDEFELKMFGIPIFESGEVLNDIQAGSLCGTTDLAVDTTGYSVYGVLDKGNLIFRFRLAGDRPSVEAYTILIDTDNKIGPDDPNANAENPGFEVDITLVKSSNQGVFIFNIDGIDYCPTALRNYAFSTHFQKSVAGTNSCNDPDYFYDFYIPFNDLTTLFGLTVKSELRFAALTNVSATCAMGGKISDIGGVNDANYTNNADAFLDLTNNQCPTALEDLCQTCAGFKTGRTPKPKINTPVKVGESIITGTAAKTADIFVSVFDASSNLLETATSQADLNGFWQVMLAAPLAFEDSVTARAQLQGQCSSGISDSDLSYAIAIYNLPSVLTGTTTALTYNENDPPISIFDDLVITDPDDSVLDSAWVSYVANYIPAEDIITLPPGQGLNISWDPALQRVEIFGNATLAVYQAVLRGIKYSNSSEDPSTLTRTFDIKVHDGLNESNVLTRDINVVNINDPPVITGSLTAIPFNEGDGEFVIDNAIQISDVDNATLVGATVSISANFISTEDELRFVDQNGITGSYNSTSGILTLTGTTTLANYQTALASVSYYNSASVDPILTADPLTRTVSYQVNDGMDLSNIFNRNIDNATTNSPPTIVDSGGTPIDTLFVSTNEDTPIYVCLDAYDPDGDAVYINTAVLKYGNGTMVQDPSPTLCFTFSPNLNFNGNEYVNISACDDAATPLCVDVVVAIEVLPVNDVPQIVDSGGNPIDTVYLQTNEDQVLDVCIDAVDVEGDPLELADAYSTGNNGTFNIYDPANFCFTYTPNLNFNGTDDTRLVVCETGSTTQCDTIVAIIEVVPVNDPPVITVGGVPVDTVFFDAQEDVVTKLCVEATDPDGNALQVTAATSLDGLGAYEPRPLGDLCFFFLANTNYNGMAYGQIVVCDDQNPALCDTVVAAINVLPVDDPPVILDNNGAPLFDTDTLYFETLEDQSLDVCISASDPDGDPLSLTNATSTDGNGSYVITDASGLCFTYTPNPNYNGSDAGTLTVCENTASGLCVSTVVVINVISVNDPPIIEVGGVPTDTVYFDVNEDTSAELCLEAVDADGDPLTLADISSSDPNGTFDNNLPADLCFNFTPALDYNGQIFANATVCDNQNPTLCDTVVVVVNVLPINDPPEIFSGGLLLDTLKLVTDEDVPVDFCFKVEDPDNPNISNPTVTSNTNLGTYTKQNTTQQCYLFTPSPNIFGIEYAVVKVCDGGVPNLCALLVIQITINSVNDPPVAVNDTIVVRRNSSVNGNVLDNDYDIENDQLTVNTQPETQPLHGEVVLNSDGTFTYTPKSAYSGDDSFSYRVCDDGIQPICVDALVYIIVEDIPLTIYQAVSPNGDGMNDYWQIDGIELFPNNFIRIFDRYNNLVFEIHSYNNQDRIWDGQSNRGISNKRVPEGSYFYVINLGDGSPPISGYIILKTD